MSDENLFLMQAAAERAIADLQNKVTAAQDSAEQAKTSADSVARSANLWKKLTLVLGIVVLVLAVTVGFGVKLYMNQQDATAKLRSQATAACETGNDRAAGTVTALDELVVLLEGSHPTAKVQQEAAAYEKFVAQHNAQRDCQSLHSP